MQPSVSILVPTYNVAQFLDRCVASILAQTYTDFELLLIDDGSTDGTADHCARWAAQDARVRTLSQPHAGIASARNVGLTEARGAHVMFVDSDDWVEPDIVEFLLHRLWKTGSQISMARLRFEDETGQEVKRRRQLGDRVLSGRDAFVALQFERWLQSYSVARIYTRQLFTGVHYPDGKLIEDYITAPSIYAKAERVVSSGRYLYHYVQHGASIMHSRSNAIELSKTFVDAVAERYAFACSSGLLTRREQELLRLKSIRRIVRHAYTLRRLTGCTFDSPDMVKVCSILSDLKGGDAIECSGFSSLYRWTTLRRLRLAVGVG